MAYELIETVTLTSAASSIEFTSIPQDGVDLVVVMSLRNGTATQNAGGGAFFLQFNDYATPVTARTLGAYASIGSGTDGFISMSATDDTANTFGNAHAYISNYTSSAAKSISVDDVSENNGTGSWRVIRAFNWNVTNAITSLRLQIAFAGNIGQHSTASLYKIS